MKKLKSANIETIAGYNLWANDYDSFENPMTAMVDWVLESDPLEVKGLSVLELGCGTGRNLNHVFSGEPSSYTGVDGSEGMLSIAKNCFSDPKVSLVLGNLEKPLPFRHGSFDIILITLVLEHLQELGTVFSEGYRILVPGGKIRILEIHHGLVTKGTKAHFWRNNQEIRFNAYPHDKSEYLNILTNAGFQIESINEWTPPRELITRLPKIGKYSEEPMLIEVVASRR